MLSARVTRNSGPLLAYVGNGDHIMTVTLPTAIVTRSCLLKMHPSCRDVNTWEISEVMNYSSLVIVL